MQLKNSEGSTKFPGGHKVFHRTAQTAFVRVVTPRSLDRPTRSFPVLQTLVVQRLDSAIHRINHYPVDSAISFPNTYPLDSDLSGG